MNSLSPRGHWILANIKPGKILDVGFAGDGNDPDVIFATILKCFPQSEVFGVDINQEKVAALNRPNTFMADGQKLPFKANTFDCVVLAEVLEHQTEPFKFLAEAYWVLKKGGIFLVTTPNPFGVFRWLRHFIFARNVASKSNLLQYRGARDHKMFLGPLSLINLLYLAGFSEIFFTTKNLSFPYFPKFIRELEIPIWPLTRLGTYTCLKAVK